MVKIIPYNPALKALARQLRKNMTFGEALLWNELKDNKLLGLDFDRQRCIDNYIVDFYCKDLQLAIEVDGSSHDNAEAVEKDIIRQHRLESLGVYFIRFTEREIKQDIFNVLNALQATVLEILKNDQHIKLPPGFDIALLND